MASDVFISYASEDRERARRVAAALSAGGWSVWWDRQIPPGRTFDEVIEEAIDSAACVIVLWSRTAVGSDWVKAEAAEGARRGVLVPAMLEAARLPLEFRRIQAADLGGWSGDPRHPEFVKLANAVAALIAPKHAEPGMATSSTVAPPFAAPPPAKPVPVADVESAAVRPGDGRRIGLAAAALALVLGGGAVLKFWNPRSASPGTGESASAPVLAPPAADSAGSVPVAAGPPASPVDASPGAALVNVPSLVGETVVSARTRVRELGLEPSVSYRDSTATQPGQVMVQRPAPGTPVTTGSVVALVVARAPPPPPPQPIGTELAKWRREADDWVDRVAKSNAAAQKAYGALVASRRRATDHASGLAPADDVTALRDEIDSAGGVAKQASIDSHAAARSARELIAAWPVDESASSLTTARRITGDVKTLAGKSEAAAKVVAQQRDVIRIATDRLLAITPRQSRIAWCNATADQRDLNGDARRRFLGECLPGS